MKTTTKSFISLNFSLTNQMFGSLPPFKRLLLWLEKVDVWSSTSNRERTLLTGSWSPVHLSLLPNIAEKKAQIARKIIKTQTTLRQVRSYIYDVTSYGVKLEWFSQDKRIKGSNEKYQKVKKSLLPLYTKLAAFVDYKINKRTEMSWNRDGIHI